MAIAAGAVWEVRSGGAITNGGAFVPGGGGTDYSQQNAAQYTFSDLASTTGTTVPSVVTSASHTFVAADVGNVMQITAGTNWTKSFFQIVSVSGGAATLDRAVGTAATLSGGTFSVGGAIKLAGAATPDSIWPPLVTPGNTVWFKADGVHTSYQINWGSGSGTLPILISGYNTTRGDNPTGANRPQIDLGIGYSWFMGADQVIKNISGYCSSTGSTSNKIFAGGNNCTFINCKARNDTTDAAQAGFVGNFLVLINCEAVCYRGYGVSLAFGGLLYGCYIHDSDVGVQGLGANSQITMQNCIIEGCATAAVQYSAANILGNHINNCTLYGAENKLGVGVSCVSGVAGLTILNSILYGFTTAVSMADPGDSICYDDYNTYFNNTTDTVNWTKGTNSIALNPSFASVAQYTGTTATTSGLVLTDGSANFANVVNNQDYVYIKSGTGVTVGVYLITGHTTTTLTLEEAPGTNATANKVYQVTTGHNFAVGSNMKGAALSVFPAGLTTGYMDIGAVQRKETLSSDPGIANVRSGTAYTIADAPLTGTLDLPAIGNVKTGITYDGASKTGTYDGSDRWSDPGIANVRSATAYKANSTSNNRTGTAAIPTAANVRSGTATDATTGSLAVPAASNVRSGTAVDATTGTLIVPAASNVRSGTGVDATTGTLIVPAAANVRSGTSVDATTGTLDLPSITDVKTGVIYDGTTKTGTYTGSDRWTDPGAANVRSGTAYKSNSTTNNRTGTATVPVASDVRSGTAVDASTGTLAVPSTGNVRLGTAVDAGTGSLVVPTLANTKIGIAGDGGTGTYNGSDRWTDPGFTLVARGTTYLANAVTKTGTLDSVTNILDNTDLTAPTLEAVLEAE